MQIINYIQFNNYSTKKFLYFFLIIQFAALAIMYFANIGIEIPYIRQSICFCYLTFLPGMLILRIIKLNDISFSSYLLFSIGLSLTFLMSIAFLINLLLPFFGVINPISHTPLTISLGLSVLALTLVNYCYERNHPLIDKRQFIDIKSPKYTFALLLIPLLSIIGTLFMNFYSINFLMIVLILIISFMYLFIINKSFPKCLYPFTIFLLSLSLIYHRSLISSYLWGYDIHTEFYYANLIMEKSIWDPTIYYSVNSILSVVLLAPIYSIICNISVVWVFKVIYPFLFSFIVLGLFLIYSKQFGPKISTLSILFFISVFSFYGELPVLPRQEIGELFLVLILMVIIDNSLHMVKRRFLLIIFSYSMIISHYGTSYIFLIIVCLSYLLLNLYLNFNINILFFSSRLNFLKNQFVDRELVNLFLKKTYLLVLLVFITTWYMNITGSSVFDTAVNIGNHIFNSLSSELLSPESADGLKVIVSDTSSLPYTLLKYLHFFSQLIISIGCIFFFSFCKKSNLNIEYYSMSLIALFLCIAAIVIPYFSMSITVTRLYHLCLIFLSPFFILGFMFSIKIISNINNLIPKENFSEFAYRFITFFLVIFLIFNSGLAHQIVKDKNPISISLSYDYDYPRFNHQEVYGAKWLKAINLSRLVYAEGPGRRLIQGYIQPGWNVKLITGDTNSTPDNALIYLRTFNINGKIKVKSEGQFFEQQTNYQNISESIFLNNVLVHKSKIYNNNGCEIWI